MTHTGRPKKGIVERIFAFAVPRPRKPRRLVAPDPTTEQLDRDMVEAFVRVVGDDGTVPSKGIYKIRNGEQRPWRVIWRRFREAHGKNASLHDVLGVLRVLERKVKEDLYKGHDGRLSS